MIEGIEVSTLTELIDTVKSYYNEWGTTTFPWFRGEPDKVKTPLLPKLYRKKKNGKAYNENRLLQWFRMKAPSLGSHNTPPRSHTDEWLFLAQHVGLPTRLLDWTEGLLIATFFALEQKKPVVWMLNPTELNRLSVKAKLKDNVYPITWVNKENIQSSRVDVYEMGLVASQQVDDYERRNRVTELQNTITALRSPNIGNINIRGAWELDNVGTDLPTAIHPTNVHQRMASQKSCFSIQGLEKDSLANLVDESILRKFVVPPDLVADIKADLKLVGITHTSVFPDLDSLASELKLNF